MEKEKSLKVENYKTVRDAVFEKLRKAILDGYFKPGQRIIENQVAEEMGVSRTPIREALRRLEIEKLVENLPRKGVMVARVNESQIKEIFNIRGVLEGLAVRLAIDNSDALMIADLEKIISEMETAIKDGDIDKQINCNTRFHDYIVRKANSPMLTEMLQNIHEQIQRYRHQSLSLEGRAEVSLSEHKDIVQEIKEKNKYGAEIFMKKHIEKAGEALMKRMGQ
ncbi:DNA-binding GntR family transcriptional regulator [Anaerosolibacter carboniphilus]|uniref:DNA-binding GntR family transcriptional regulator n=1 Tax=Anaerosolibacter carboniphilus TaxID=1417629 RepID=A0A841KY65_9FIRM|nr:GntR family transcriptional regulator [Anaerosolibacter carboniphilus]MBB6218574.1 DNA-binding GntR family transcriptional regulator [Anaerosolibacter carboniphilus]